LRIDRQAVTVTTTASETTGKRELDDAGIAEMTTSGTTYTYTAADASRYMDTPQAQPAQAMATGGDDWITTTDVCGGTSEYVLVAPGGKTGCTSIYDTRGVIVVIVLTDSTETGTELRCHSTIEAPLGTTPSTARPASARPTEHESAQATYYYYGRRYYSPELGRWMSRDPIGEKGGIGLYGFCGNSALRAWDYLGLDTPNESDYPSPLKAAEAAAEYFGHWFFNGNVTEWNSGNNPSPKAVTATEAVLRLYYRCETGRFYFAVPLGSTSKSCAGLVLPANSIDAGWVHFHLSASNPSPADYGYAKKSKMFFIRGNWAGDYKKPSMTIIWELPAVKGKQFDFTDGGETTPSYELETVGSGQKKEMPGSGKTVFDSSGHVIQPKSALQELCCPREKK